MRTYRRLRGEESHVWCFFEEARRVDRVIRTPIETAGRHRAGTISGASKA